MKARVKVKKETAFEYQILARIGNPLVSHGRTGLFWTATFADPRLRCKLV